ncbi:hypothetical protein AJ80_07705 [Polytolypa hystricis UAMH7299]|uniref:C2H2-type domain-containing protein n=1 Tax=Polytolypa hystricis (strain UAMH7299) TaxID=1447883 RepID=A0A2B7XKT8_POLH7|nr:hypothetical protein AJ80_07705 [Polytolypa hystricis UAMH7299]
MTLIIDTVADIDKQPPNARRRSRVDESDPLREEAGASAQEDASGSTGDGHKKRRRSRKIDSDKKFECKHEGCGKSYSRAEHLYRHQLNHTPKQIYRCDFPDCYRSFVRQDLCVRHRERHTTHGSQLQKRDNFAHAASTLVIATGTPRDQAHAAANGSTQLVSPTDGLISPKAVSRPQFPAPSPTNTTNSINSGTPNYMGSTTGRSGGSSAASMETPFQPLTPQTAFAAPESHIKRSDSTSSYTLSPPKTQAAAIFGPPNRQSSYSSYDGQRYPNTAFNPADVGSLNHPSNAPAIRARQMSSSAPYMSSPNLVSESSPAVNPNSYVSHQNIQMSSLPPPGYSSPQLTRAASASIAAALSNGLSAFDPMTGVVAPGSSVSDMDSMVPYAIPIFGGETLNRSPFAMSDDFTAWLFNEHATNTSPIGYPSVPGMVNHYSDPFSAQLQSGYYPSDATFSYFTNMIPQQHPMSVTSILDSEPPQSIMSEEKRNELLDLIQTRFNETDHAAVKKRKDALMDGNIDADSHVLSLRMMQTYIGSYWYHNHDQLPILHKPTFAADKTPELLLLAVIAIGAATLDKLHGQDMTEAASELANFLAWHIRWEIFQHVDFRPPAKLWIFQTLLLLEIYEKMYSTRALHERAHIHHDTTLTLMRRGSSLIGRSAFDSPPSLRDDRQNRSATGSGTNSASESGAGEESWAPWIKSEATRRVAFAAFVLDSTHATMFGHSAKMVAHEMRLPLPCDEALWSATSAAEVGRVQASLHANGIKPTMFLDGLKKTLNGQKVRTNSFGRTIIMAGLLSVSWHMNQRDLQVSSLGVAQALGGRDKWRSALLRAFDNWKRDFDEALVESNPSGYSGYRQQAPTDDDIIFESRTVLHHLAHMASHVDVVDCQIFAGAGRLLGRSITPKDYSTAREKMTERWATKASARDAAFYALKFLAQVLIPEEGRPGSSAYHNAIEYSAHDDFLLNRPWVLYFSALVVWCYGYALDGPITPTPPPLNTAAEQRKDMREFLERVGGVRAPDDLNQIRDRNRCMGLLMILRETFSHTRWELLHEAANLLGSCIEKLKSPPTNPASGIS